MIFSFLFYLFIHFEFGSNSETIPIYQYLKELCLPGQLPLTSNKNVKACSPLCPFGAICYKGICCVSEPQCRHPSFRTSTGHPCLPNVQNNCPEGSLCVASSQDGMFICCSSKISARFSSLKIIVARKENVEFRGFPTILKNKKNPLKPQISNEINIEMSQVCPESHPIVARVGQSLVLCKDCQQGICAKFRKSSVEVCCQNSNDICGAGSHVLMDSFIPRDCSKHPCDNGFECSITPSGSRVCCSLAQCPSGVFARSICAAGCLRNEKCVSIQNEMWCCPLFSEVRSREMQCSNKTNGRKLIGKSKCDPRFPLCPPLTNCQLNSESTAHLCCPTDQKQEERTSIFPKKIKSQNKQISTFSPKKPTTTTTESIIIESEEILKCLDGSDSLFINNLSVMCSKLGELCPEDGYSCKLSDVDDVFVCCSDLQTFTPKLPDSKPETITSSVISSSMEKTPTCPFSYIPSIKENQEIQRCLTLFSFDCPFGYTCLPSSTTDTYLCCMRKPLI